MQLAFGTLTIQGFRSFDAPTAVDLSVPGLTYLLGENRVEPHLGANGVGKSSIFEALFWVLYGKTSRNLRAGDVANWNGKHDCLVALTLVLPTRAGLLSTVQRTWSPNTLTLDGVVTTQPELTALVGLGEEAFLHTIAHQQFVPHFADRPPAVQLELFSEVLALEVWERASDLAGEQARRVAGQVQQAELKVASALATVRERLESVEAEEVREGLWWRDQVAKCQLRSAELKKAKKEAVALAAIAVVAATDPRVLRDAEEKLAEAIKAASEVGGVLNQALENARSLEEHEGGKCPTCLQPITKAVWNTVRTELQAWRETYQARLADEKACAKQAREAKAKAEAGDAHLQRAHKAEEAVTAAEQALWRAIGEECPYDVIEVERRYTAAQNALTLAKEAVAATSKRVAACQFWITGFKDIRLSLVRRALTQFEVTTNSALALLGLPDWEVTYDVESETKSGKTSKGFRVFVQSPYNNEPVPFTAWSGGESQRLRLAITLGLSDLIQDSTGVQSNLEIFDEPTAWLSTEGITDLLAVLQGRAEERQMCIILADHKALDQACATRVLEVVKTTKGSEVLDG